MRGALPLLFLLSFFLTQSVSAQTPTDTSATLPEVVVKAFEQNRRQRDVAAAVSVVGPAALQRFSPASIVQAVNTAPGVRLEERSPGSYRVNIRGSSLRSPFGVRNVKVYFNDIPITDPGGNTFLNQLGAYNFAQLEIIKGPGSSLYGAGTGGVLLIEGLPSTPTTGAVAEYSTGSFGLHNAYASATTASPTFVSRLGFQHQQSEGYRQHSRLRRNVLTWTTTAKPGAATTLKTTVLYGDLFYQTPGALTKAEFTTAPTAARPGSGAFPGAVAAGASINQQQVLAGAVLSQQFAPRFSNKTVAYGMFTQVRNPAIQNYGRTTEPHGGLRTSFLLTGRGKLSNLQLLAGAEMQAGWPTVNIYKNAGGRADSLRSTDAIQNNQTLLFAQAGWDDGTWQLTAGAGLSLLRVSVERFSPAPSSRQTRRFNNGVAPRVSLLRRLGEVSVYAALSRGFSPPTTAELLPTGGVVNLELNAEEGWNKEVGIKGTLPGNLWIDVNVFHFGLRNAIVQQRTAGGGDFYLNSGSTEQWGVETALSKPLLPQRGAWRRSGLWVSHSFHQFRYASFAQGSTDYSGKRMPATPRHNLSAGVDLFHANGFLASVNYLGVGRIPLNDANTEYADAYHLVGGRVGYERRHAKTTWRLVVGAENLFDQTYSLGNDVNGFGGRYYNAAPRRNFFALLSVGWQK